VVHVLGAHGSASLDVGTWETSSVGNADELLNILTTASNTIRSSSGAESRLRIGINANEAHTKGELVSIDLLILSG